MKNNNASSKKRLREFKARIESTYGQFIGFPGSTDFDYHSLYPMFDYLLNNVGDPYDLPYHANHSKEFEQEVIEFFADLFRAPKDDRWGYVTNGGSEGNLYALYVARELYPDSYVYFSEATHYSNPKNAHLLRMPSVTVLAQESGEIDYVDLQKQLLQRADKPAIIIANIGTTMTEAKDDVAKIKGILRSAGIYQSFIHSDAALAGTYAALQEPRPAFDFGDGADSISISGHKFIGSPMACGVVLVRKKHRDAVARQAEYVGAADTTITGSRNGHTPLLLWYSIQRWGVEGFKKRAEQGMALAEYLETQCTRIGWKAWRNPGALTVVIEAPPDSLVYKWQLACQGGWSHVICMPGVQRKQIDAFLRDLELAKTGTIV